MRYLRLATTALALVLATTSLLAQKQLQLLATIADPGGKEITTVDAAEVTVKENGSDLKITKVEPFQRIPKLQILIDNGLGMPSASLSDLRTAVKGLLSALPPNLEVSMFTTAPQPRTLQKPTTDKVMLISAVDRIAPDSGTGRFMESLYEATDRIEKDKQEGASYTIVTIGTTSGDLNVRESDMNTTIQRVAKRHTTVDVVLLNGLNTGSGGVVQTDLGQAVTRASGGRMETIAVANRMLTLLPEIGKQLATSMGPGSKQVKITVERPTAGALGQVSVGVAGKDLLGVALAQ
jgi:hypothetical protein